MSNSDSDSTGKINSLAWIREDIKELKDNKADDSYVRSELDSIKSTSDRIRKTAEEALKKEHHCSQSEVINKMQRTIEKIWKTLDSWKNVKIGVIISVIVIIVAATGNYFVLSSNVNSNTKTISEIKITQKETNDKITSDVNTIKLKLESNKIEQFELDKKRNKELKDILKEAVYELITIDANRYNGRLKVKNN